MSYSASSRRSGIRAQVEELQGIGGAQVAGDLAPAAGVSQQLDPLAGGHAEMVAAVGTDHGVAVKVGGAEQLLAAGAALGAVPGVLPPRRLMSTETLLGQVASA